MKYVNVRNEVKGASRGGFLVEFFLGFKKNYRTIFWGWFVDVEDDMIIERSKLGCYSWICYFELNSAIFYKVVYKLMILWIFEPFICNEMTK